MKVWSTSSAFSQLSEGELFRRCCNFVQPEHVLRKKMHQQIKAQTFVGFRLGWSQLPKRAIVHMWLEVGLEATRM